MTGPPQAYPGPPQAHPAHPGATGVPGPPPGPGVQPPFVAPPTDGTRQRRWLAVGLAAAAALLCCVGGLGGLAGIVVLGGRAIVDEARTAVTNYVGALQRKDYPAAYKLLCDAEQSRVNPEQFARSFDSSPAILSFVVDQPVIENDVEVPATLHYDNGATRRLSYLLEQDTSTGQFEVCGSRG